jgi:hypothetical protein
VDLKTLDEDLKSLVRQDDSLQLKADTQITVDPEFKVYQYDTFGREEWSAWVFEVIRTGGKVQYFDDNGNKFVAKPPKGQGALVVIPKLDGCQETEFWGVKAKKIGPV